MYGRMTRKFVRTEESRGTGDWQAGSCVRRVICVRVGMSSVRWDGRDYRGCSVTLSTFMNVLNSCTMFSPKCPE